ncbi:MULTISPECIES: YwmB family TATA-box binding protein [Clostridia]|uniref:YwmB family TATA-box binding protein n=1 Tax=Clostridium sp. CCUG 7971 TaxID=2811414 RepID=UPI001ABA9A5A|nr:YwmB family TATA-box binding protein [Clostridium sp. CCUG 7971]MBO3446368.1 YwmB family TATA-box binding protein [Clostridium sp. CCUG 7971]
MKIIKLITSFILLMIIGIVISYADIKSNNEYNKLIETFDNTQANFKFYNIKANGVINYDISKNEMRDIFVEIINNLGLEESNMKWEENWNNNQNQIYAQVQNEEKNISISGIKKNDEEAYIMVDILENKVYKNIVDIYTILENTLNKHVQKVDINTCISGEYTKKLQMNKYDDIFQEILYNMNAKEIDRVEEENFISITAYSKVLKDNYLEYLGDKINLNIGMRYSEDDEKTIIYIATPIIKLDY